MNTNNTVVSLEHSVISHMENAIVDILSNRAGKWVGQHVVMNAAEPHARPNMSTMGVIEGMVSSGLLEKSFQTVNDKLHRAVRLPLYRLATKGW